MNKYFDQSLSYSEYIGLIDRLLIEGKTTGPIQSESMLQYAKLNRQRMRRLMSTIEPDQQTVKLARSISRKMIWLIITEGWCGDAAQSIPVIEIIAAESSNVETRYVLRDENLELMDRFVDLGARSIPKLIALDASTLDVLGTWGPRPVAAQELFQKLRAEGVEKSVIMERLQRWYNEDRGRTIQQEVQAAMAAWDVGLMSACATV